MDIPIKNRKISKTGTGFQIFIPYSIMVKLVLRRGKE